MNSNQHIFKSLCYSSERSQDIAYADLSSLQFQDVLDRLNESRKACSSYIFSPTGAEVNRLESTAQASVFRVQSLADCSKIKGHV